MDKPNPRAKVGVTRRDFFKTASTGWVASHLTSSSGAAATLSAESHVTFVPSSTLTRISSNLFMLADTCNVYVLRHGDRGLLIDFGSGHAIELIGELGISKIEGILHTHHHRDQCQGDGRARAQGIPIYVPTHERHLFEDAANFWRNRHIFDNYDVRNDFFTLTENVQVAGVLADYGTFRWGPYSFLILPTPGHTLGAISLVGEVDGKKVAFTGDLIHSPGKVQNLYELQYHYQSSDGVDCAIYSLTKLTELAPALVCPSHGVPFENPGQGIAELVQKLRDWFVLYSPDDLLTVDSRPFAVSPHLACAYKDTSTVYALISDSGKALFLDYGSASLNFMYVFMEGVQRGSVRDRMRFVEHAHTIQELGARFGMKSIDLAMPSHMHDDHINGFPYLVQNYGTKIWCYENMVDILQNPRGYNLGCTFGEPIKVDRSLRDGETFKWEEFELTVSHFPGHTEFQMALFGLIDGARIAFTGDNFFPASVPSHIWPHDFPAYQLQHTLCFRNWVESDSHLNAIRKLIDYEPTMLAPAHGKPFLSNKEDLEELKTRLEKQRDYFTSVIADPDCNFGLNPSWVRLYPYQLAVKRGSRADVQLIVRNYRGKAMHLEARLSVAVGWKALPEVLHIEVPANANNSGSFTLCVPQDWDPSRQRVAVAVDVVADGKYLGEVAEGVVDLHPSA